MASSKAPIDYVNPSERPCPKCQQPLQRTKRRGIDRLTSLFVPVARYRCRNFSCRWEGNLRETREK